MSAKARILDLTFTICRGSRFAFLYASIPNCFLLWSASACQTQEQDRTVKSLEELAKSIMAAVTQQPPRPRPARKLKRALVLPILTTSDRSLRPYLPYIYPQRQAIGHGRIEQRGQSLRNRLRWGTHQPRRLSGKQYRDRCYCKLACDARASITGLII